MLIVALALGVGLLAPASAQAMSSYYSASCASCHGASPSTCNGCHHHRGTVTGALPKSTFSAGESIAITVSAGQRTGFWRAAVLDASNAVLATTAATAQGATTVTVNAPSTAGTYTWKVAWYGNKYTETPGAGWVEDAGNTGHGYLTTALAAFTVQGAQPPPPTPKPVAGLSPTSLALGSVTTGQSTSKTATVSNTGNADLVVSAATPCSGSNPASLTLSPAGGFTVAAGATATLTVTFAPSAAGAASACWSLATNDTALQLDASGTGADQQPPPPTPKPVAGLSPTSLALGNVNTGQSTSQTATVSNTGNADLVVAAAAPCSGANPASVTVAPAGGFTVAAGATATVTVSFSPTAAGAASACFSFGTNDTAHATLQLNATGTGVDVTPPPSGPCQACHSNPPTSGQHTFHTNAGEGCGSCHGAGYSNNTVVDTLHNNGTLDVAASTGYDKAASSCSNACHGSKNWTGGGVTPPPPTQSCTTCHAIPPSTGKHSTHGKQQCADCHGAGYSTTTVVAATHQDGKATLGSGAGWNAATKSCSNACHGSKSWSSGGGSSSGGSSSGGGTTGACNSCHKMPPTSGRHTMHTSEHVSCAACHGSGYSTTTVNASTHRNGSVTLASKVGWNGSSRSCSNSCHGKETWGSSGGTSSGGSSSGGSSSGGSSGGATSCTGCHKIPPANGEHAKHLKKKVSCGTCHGSGYSTTSVNAATHQDGKITISSKIGFNASRRTCQNSCHGRESWVKSKGGGDDKERDDFVLTEDATDGGEKPTAGGCSSAGGAMPILGLLGVALLGLRRRRSA